MVPAFSEAAAKLAIGSSSEPVETKFGYHVIQRNDLPPEAGARHILIMHVDSQRKAAGITRSKEDALARSREALEKIRAGEDFATLAAEYSDGPTKTRGGDLGVFQRGRMVPPFDTALFELKVGEVSDIVETLFGYHIIKRYQ
jgi:peptidyl-prolyl cis-trans isomerase SurA